MYIIIIIIILINICKKKKYYNSLQKGLVLGAYDGCTAAELKLTKIAQQFDEETGGKIKHLLKGYIN